METITGTLFILVKCLFVLAHVTGNNSFPQPLSSEDEEYHLKRYAEGHEDSRNILIEHNLRLVAHIVKKYSNTGKEVDDLISIGTIGLIKAISTYNLEKKTRLATYAARCIENEILMTIRASKKTKGEVSLQDPIGIDKEGNEITLIDILGSDPNTVTDQVELKLQTKKMYTIMQLVLKKREQIVLEMRYGLTNGKIRTQREIAQLLGISRSYVSRIEKRAILKLAKAMDPECNLGGEQISGLD